MYSVHQCHSTACLLGVGVNIHTERYCVTFAADIFIKTVRFNHRNSLALIWKLLAMLLKIYKEEDTDNKGGIWQIAGENNKS